MNANHKLFETELEALTTEYNKSQNRVITPEILEENKVLLTTI